MGYMQAYRVGGNSAESAIRKISLLLTGEGIDCDELGDHRPDIGCVLVDFMSGEDLVKKTEQTVPQLPQIVVASTQLLGAKQLHIADEFVSPDLPDAEIIRRIQRMEDLVVRLCEEVPEPKHTRILLDGATEGEDAALEKLANTLNEAEIEWAQLEADSDEEGTGIIYAHYRREGYARLLLRDYPGYVHIQMAPTNELRAEALTVGDLSYTRSTSTEEILTRHKRLLQLIHRVRNPEEYRRDPLEHRDRRILFVGDRIVGSNLKNQISEGLDIRTTSSVAGAVGEAKKSDAVVIHLGAKEDAKERFTFLQLLLKDKETPPKALYFANEAPERMKGFCTQNGVTVIEDKTADEVQEMLLALCQ